MAACLARTNSAFIPPSIRASERTIKENGSLSSSCFASFWFRIIVIVGVVTHNSDLLLGELPPFDNDPFFRMGN